MIIQARALYANEDLGLELSNTVYALDLLTPEAGAIYVMDRGYVDFARLHRLHLAGAFFVTRSRRKECVA